MRRTGIILAVALLAVGCSEAQRAEEPSAENIEKILAEYRSVNEDTWRGVGTLECRFTKANWCGDEGCSPAKASTVVRWTPDTKSYERCDEKGCDRYDAQVSYSGAYANIAVPESGMLARLMASNRMLEVATLMESALVRHGQCEPARAAQ